MNLSIGDNSDVDINKIYNEDCLDTMCRMPNEFIDLTITSPPYDNLRTYGNERTLEFECVALEIYRVTKTGGVVIWVVGDATIGGSETGTSFKQALFFKEVGFNLHDTMIWDKCNFTSVGDLQIRYAPVFDFMFVLSRGKPKTFHPIKDRPNKSFGEVFHNSLRQRDGTIKDGCGKGVKVITEYGQRHNIWRIHPEKDNNKRLHPAQFPEALANDHIVSWSNVGDLVYDPFSGSGTTAKMALLNNRNYVGSEISKEYCVIAERRIAE